MGRGAALQTGSVKLPQGANGFPENADDRNDPIVEFPTYKERAMPAKSSSSPLTTSEGAPLNAEESQGSDEQVRESGRAGCAPATEKRCGFRRR
jgi:hypothetical protein